MKIYAARRDEILKQKAEYQASRKEAQARYDRQYSEYTDAIEAQARKISSYLEHEFEKFNLLDFDIYVDPRSVIDEETGKRGRLYGVRIECNDRRIHDDTSALSWTYKVQLLPNGKTERESSSWSGLNATTEENIESLSQTLDALKFLLNVDWAGLLNLKVPEYDDYITEHLGLDQSPKFDFMLLEDELIDAAGTDKGFKGYNKDTKNPGWYVITKVTPKRFYTEFYTQRGVEYLEGETLEDKWHKAVNSRYYYDAYTIPRSESALAYFATPLETIE